MPSLSIITRSGAVAVPVVARHGAFSVCPLPGRPGHWCIAKQSGRVVLRSSSLAGLLGALPLLVEGRRIGRVCALVWAHERTERHGVSKWRETQLKGATARMAHLTGSTADALLTPAAINPYQTDLEEQP
jgi:hypothetical protein